MAQFRIAEKDYTKERFIELLGALINGYYDFARLYKNFGAVQISHQHPFALLSMTPDGARTGIFPCVSVNIPEESEADEVLNYEEEDIDVTSDMIDTWLALPDGQRLISTEKLTEIKGVITTGGKPITALRRTKRIHQTLTCAIWAQHFQIRDALYQACRSCFIQHKKELEDEGFNNWTVSGASDLYNVEFGMMLFGGEVRAVGTNYTVDYLLNTEWEDFAEGDIAITVTPKIKA